MKNLGYSIVLIAVCLAMFSCKKVELPADNQQVVNTSPDPDLDIYIGGFYYQDNGMAQAAYWKNGLMHTAGTEGLDNYAFGIALAENHVVLVGESDNRPTLWIDDLFIPLCDASGTGNATSVQIKNDQIFICGTLYAGNEDGTQRATFWVVDMQGNILLQQALESLPSQAKDLKFNGDDLYISGSIGDLIGKPCYWKRSNNVNDPIQVRVDLDQTNSGIVLALEPFQNKVFATGFRANGGGAGGYPGAGEESTFANVYWENTTFHSSDLLTNQGYFSDLAIGSDGIIYQAGYKYEQNSSMSRAMLWTGSNFVPQQLSVNASSASKIKLNDADVYIAGDEKDSACYWKNGLLVGLNTPKSYGRDIVLVSK